MTTDTATAAPQGTVATTAAPIAPAAPVPPVIAAPPADEPDVVKMPSKALAARLAEERDKASRATEEKFAKDLGIPIADAKKLIADAKAKNDAEKSEVQRLAEQKAALEQQLAEFAAYKATVEGRASIEFAGLTEAQRAAVETIAGTDPAKRLATIDALKPTWAAVMQAQTDAQKAAAEAAAKAAAEAAKVAAHAPGPAGAQVPAPATTAPAAQGNAPPAPGQPTNHLAVYEQLKREQPFVAAGYFDKHSAAIIAARNARNNQPAR